MEPTKTKDLAYYMNLPYHIRLWPEVDGWAAKVEELPGCIAGGDTREETLEILDGAKELWLSTRLERGSYIPEPSE